MKKAEKDTWLTHFSISKQWSIIQFNGTEVELRQWEITHNVGAGKCAGAKQHLVNLIWLPVCSSARIGLALMEW